MTTGIAALLVAMVGTFGFIAGIAVKDGDDGAWYGIPAILAGIALFLTFLFRI
jgi:hypothetical protein